MKWLPAEKHDLPNKQLDRNRKTKCSIDGENVRRNAGMTVTLLMVSLNGEIENRFHDQRMVIVVPPCRRRERGRRLLM
jgi:hypothetical protein